MIVLIFQLFQDQLHLVYIDTNINNYNDNNGGINNDSDNNSN